MSMIRLQVLQDSLFICTKIIFFCKESFYEDAAIEIFQVFILISCIISEILPKFVPIYA